MTKTESRNLHPLAGFVIRASVFFRHSSFVIDK